jgi:radical SAM superfamily enzyme YgiQ (UPF0313 family)
MRTIIVTPPVRDAWTHAMPQLGAAVIRGFLQRRGFSVDIVDLAVRARVANRYRIGRRFDLDVYFGDPARVRAYLCGGRDAGIERETQKLVDLGHLDTYDVVGFSVPDIEALRPTLCLARALKEAGGPTIVLGGNLFTRGEYRGLLDFDYVDYLVLGDGELPMLQILEGGGRAALEPVKSLPVVASAAGASGLYFRRDGRVVGAGEAAFPIADKAPPAFDPEDLRLHRRLSPKARTWAPYLMTRGCRYKCSYCSDYPNVRFEYVPADKIVADVCAMRDRWGVDCVFFVESNLNNDLERVRGVCERLIAARAGVCWGGLATLWDLDEPTIALMSKAGCRFLMVGIESGSEAVNAEMNSNKCKRLERIKEVMQLLDRHRIRLHTYYIVGFPYESDADFRDTVRFLAETAPYVLTAQATAFEVMEDTPIFRRPEKFGLRLRDDGRGRWRFLTGRTEHPYDEIEGLAWEAKDALRRERKRLFDRAVFKHIDLPRYARHLVTDPGYLARRAVAYPYFNFDMYL